MEPSQISTFIQAVGLPAAFSFALLWIVERRLSKIAEDMARVLTILERTAQDLSAVVSVLVRRE